MGARPLLSGDLSTFLSPTLLLPTYSLPPLATDGFHVEFGGDPLGEMETTAGTDPLEYGGQCLLRRTMSFP